MADLERRAATGLTVSNRRLVGYAARFNSEARIADFREVIRAGAFRQSLASGRDILCLRDHDPAVLLGRTKSGTLELREDDNGLSFSLQVPDTQAGHDLLALAERGDLGGMSFGFRVTEDAWTGDLRELRSVELHEVSIVQAFPAYAATSVEARSLRPFDARRAWLETCR
jgi:HK97 family phage prohead protease